MALPAYTPADFVLAMQNLLPQGRAWTRDPDAVLTKTLLGLAGSYARSTQRAGDLLVDAFPLTTYELLPEWEDTLGLPDPCAGPAASVEERRTQVAARFAAKGGQSVAYLIEYAASLGYEITIENTGDNEFQVNFPGTHVVYFRAGLSVAGDPLASGGNDVLECEIEAVKPAHTVVTFNYT